MTGAVSRPSLNVLRVHRVGRKGCFESSKVGPK